SLMRALTTDKESRVRWRAAFALGSIGSEKAVEPLKRALKDENKSFLGKVNDRAFSSLEEISKRIKKRIALDATQDSF
ncbi:hypothetical protein CEE45_17805, partial [Candidatus Heimdallarchaeota archaeon B3_Heim]